MTGVPQTSLTKQQGSKLVKLIIAGMICFLLLLAYVLYQSYQGRADLISAQRASCERGKLDRRDNATGWRTAEIARLKTLAESMHISYKAAGKVLAQKPDSEDLPDLVAARRYNKIASNLERRGRISCAEAFPKAGFLP